MSRTSGFSRRHLLSSATGLGAFIWVPRLARAADPHEHMNMSSILGIEPRKPPPAMDAPLIEPEMRRSVNGVLQTTLRCAYSYRDIGGVRLYVRSYEGGSPGPTLRMKPGETLKIRMPNDFPPNRDLMPMDLSNPTKGSYLYHPHHHGSADIQVASGMASVQQHELPFPRQPRGP